MACVHGASFAEMQGKSDKKKDDKKAGPGCAAKTRARCFRILLVL